MNSVIFMSTVRYITPVMLAFSFFMLLRGHNDPGGGFIGGLLAVSAFALYMLAFGGKQAAKLLGAPPANLMAVGLILAAGSGLFAWLIGQPYMTGLWIPMNFPAELKLGTILLFDIGVFLVVVGAVLLMLFSLSED